MTDDPNQRTAEEIIYQIEGLEAKTRSEAIEDVVGALTDFCKRGPEDPDTFRAGWHAAIMFICNNYGVGE